MTEKSSSPPPPQDGAAPESAVARRKKAAAAGKEVKAEAPKKPSAFQPFFSLLRAVFTQGPVVLENIPDEDDAMRRYHRLMVMIWWQGLTIIVLVALLILGTPFLQPYYKYSTISPENERVPLAALDKPNMTDRALLSWATTSITDVLTLGFGDIDKQIVSQRKRFTEPGWNSFLKAIFQQEFLETFKSKQLILTTVPSDTPVIVAQGIDIEGDGEYQWMIEMPIIMNFVTNNSVKRQQRGIVRLTITRVPSSDSVRGIAIKSWQMG